MHRRRFLDLGFKGLAVIGAESACARKASPAASYSARQIRFENRQKASHVDFVLNNATTPNKPLIDSTLGGVALFDFDNDGFLDIFFTNGAQIPSLEKDNPTFHNRLYRNNRDGTFTDVTDRAGLQGEGYCMGVAAADFDNDGWTDLYVTGVNRNILYHNNGDGTFTDVTAKAGVEASGWSVSAGFFDYDNDGKLDLFVTRYMEWDTKHSKTCGGEWHTYCPPEEFPATTSILYHNNGDGTFTDVSQKSGIAGKKGRALGVAFADYDDDGFTDIFVANDGMQQYLYHNNRDGTFTERALEAGAALSEDGRRLSGMGVVFQDYDNDGRPDVIVTELPREIYGVYHNEGNGTFSYGSLETGLGVLSSGSSGWGVGLEDFGNDGWKDLFVAQGHVLDNVEQIDPSLHYWELPLLAVNHNGHFERVDSGSATPVAGRGAAFGDLNNDGWQVVVMTALGGPPQFFFNRSGKRHWLVISLRGTRSNRDGFGARVRVNGQTRFATSAGSYLSSSDKRLHFGLGVAETAKIEIAWPSGARQILNDVHADQFLEVREPEKP
jgi:hypothetical protein